MFAEWKVEQETKKTAAMGKPNEKQTERSRAYRKSGVPRTFLCYTVCFFFLGPLGLEVGFFCTPLRKWVLSNFSKKTKNPNPSPIGKRFGLHWFGAADGT